jgi:hypothetical protein
MIRFCCERLVIALNWDPPHISISRWLSHQSYLLLLDVDVDLLLIQEIREDLVQVSTSNCLLLMIVSGISLSWRTDIYSLNGILDL